MGLTITMTAPRASTSEVVRPPGLLTTRSAAAISSSIWSVNPRMWVRCRAGGAPLPQLRLRLGVAPRHDDHLQGAFDPEQRLVQLDDRPDAEAPGELEDHGPVGPQAVLRPAGVAVLRFREHRVDGDARHGRVAD